MRPRAGSCRLLPLFLLCTGFQHTQPGVQQVPRVLYPSAGPLPPNWYAGDTHEHVQYCDRSIHPLSQIRSRMVLEDLSVASVLIWDLVNLPFHHFVCRVTGTEDPLSWGDRVLQYGVETSGLDCGKWGHLIGLGIGPAEARIAQGSIPEGACAPMSGLGLGCPGGDGTGCLNAPIARHFASATGAVSGYAHTVWTLGLQHPGGYDWTMELLASGFTTDTVCLDTAQRLAVPELEIFLENMPLHRAFFPMLGAMDAVLGDVQFVETTVMGPDFPIPLPVELPAHWPGLYYKLLSAGVRLGLAAGSDRACLPASEYPRTYVLAGDELDYGEWIQGLAAGRTTLALGKGLFLRLRVAGQEVGSEVALTSPELSTTAEILLQSDSSLDDCVQLIVDGEIRGSHPVSLEAPGKLQLDFSGVVFTESSWVAARLCSQRAHTAAVYVIVDGSPISDCPSAEYWMLWCDIVRKTVQENPGLELFECQEAEALDHVLQARRAFKTLRDIGGFDASWEVTRYGLSSPACRGPIAIGITGPVQGGAPFTLTCVNAPPQTDGFALVSRLADPAGTCTDGARSFVDRQAGALLGAHPVTSTPSGYAEVEIPAVPPGEGLLHAQFVWNNPPDCARASCDAGPPLTSTSDALQIVVH